MTQISGLIAFVVSLAAAVVTIGIGAFLLRSTVKDASDLASVLPTRLVKEDTNEIRESNRKKALSEILLLLGLRSAPGAILVIFGAGLLAWVCYLLLPAFRI